MTHDSLTHLTHKTSVLDLHSFDQNFLSFENSRFSLTRESRNKNGNLLITEGLEYEKWKKINVKKKPCQESGLCNRSYARYSEKRFTCKFTKLFMETPCLCPFQGHKYGQIWPPETNRNICFWVFLLMPEFFAWGTHKD